MKKREGMLQKTSRLTLLNVMSAIKDDKALNEELIIIIIIIIVMKVITQLY